MSHTAGSDPRPLTAVVLGCGRMASGYDLDRPVNTPDQALSHAGVLTTHPGFTLLAGVDPAADQRQQFTRRWGRPAVASLAELSPDSADPPDLLVITTPTACHPAGLEAALALRPRLVICEKPLTGNPHTSADWLARLAAADIPVAVNYSRRWCPDLAALVARIHAGEFGPLLRADGWYGKGLRNNGSHWLNFLDWVAGPLTLISATAPCPDFFADDPTLDVRLHSAGNAPISLHGVDCRAYQLFELTMLFRDASLTLEEGGRRLRWRRVATNPLYPTYRTLDAGTEHLMATEAALCGLYDGAAAFLRHGTPLACDGQAALAVEHLCAAATPDRGPP